MIIVTCRASLNLLRLQVMHTSKGSETMSVCLAKCFQPEDQAHVNGCQVIVALRYGGREGGREREAERSIENSAVNQNDLLIEHYVLHTLLVFRSFYYK